VRRFGALLLAVFLVGCGQSSSAAVASPSHPPSPSPSPTATASPSPTYLADWPEYHGGAARTGLGPAVPALMNPRHAWTVGVDGLVYASPLIVHNRVIVATENDTVYSFDVQTGATVWRTHLGSPVDAGTLECGDIGPVTGITGTPAADPQSGQLYVVGFVSGYHHVLFTLNLANGTVVKQQGVDPAGSSPPLQQQRGALSIASGYVYVPIGGLYGDCGDYHGYVVGVPRAGGSMLVYRTPSARESGIWSAMGATISDDGSIYVVTGNGSLSSSFDYSNTVLMLSPDLKVRGFFAPRDWNYLDATDTDLGSVGVALLPTFGVLISVGKEGVAYLLRAGNPGGIGGQVASLGVCNGAWGGSAWVGSEVFLPCANGLVGMGVSATAFSLSWRAPEVHLASPIVAAGAVWAIDVETARLYALDPLSGGVLYVLPLGAAQHFSTPAATQGFVIAPAGMTVVAVATAPPAPRFSS
jgi:hypothetical protein